MTPTAAAPPGLQSAETFSKPVDIAHKLPPLKALTSVRFLAAFYVALFHTNVASHFPGLPFLARFLRSGYTGVTFFFVLSGFILAYNYPAIASPKKFWSARFARVYPVYFLSIVLAIAMHGLHGQAHPVFVTVMVLGLLQAFYPPVFTAINPVAWTLSVEAFFYLVLPALLPWMRRLRWRGFVALQAAYLSLTILPAVLSASGHSGPGTALAVWLESSVPFFRLNTFLVGVFLGLRWDALHRRQDASLANSKLLRTAACAAAGGAIWLLQLNPVPLYLPVRTLGLTYVFALLIVGLAESRNRLLIGHTAQMAGEISYGFYILQFPVIAICGDLVYRIWPAADMSERAWLFLPAIVFSSYASFRWFEIPARLWLRRRLTGRPVPVRPV